MGEAWSERQPTLGPRGSGVHKKVSPTGIHGSVSAAARPSVIVITDSTSSRS